MNVWNTIHSAVNPDTRKDYRRIFDQFLSYAAEEGRTIRDVEINTVLSFLQGPVEARLSASSIRRYYSAIVYFLEFHQRFDLRDSPLLKKFLRGAQKQAPLPVKKCLIWDPQVALDFLEKKAIPDDWFEIAHEALFLLLLATGLRLNDASKLGLPVRDYDDHVFFPFLEPRKCLISGSHTPFEIVQKFPKNPRICPVRAINLFLQTSAAIRAPGEKFLFISSTGRRAAVPTLQRWTREIMQEVGIVDSPGSCRSAVSSALIRSDVSIDEVLKSAGWSSVSTFRRYYCRKVAPLSTVKFFSALKSNAREN